MLKIGLAGFSQGYYAVTYMRYLSARLDVVCAGVCDLGATSDYVRECAFTTAEQFAGELGAPRFTNLEDLLDASPNAILVCCETHQHAELAARALAKGIHVFVSKPLSFRQRDFAPLRAAAGNAVLLCGNPLRYQPDILNLAKRVEAGEIGKPYAMRATVCHQAMIHQAWERDPALSGGNLGTYAPYLFDLQQWIIKKKFQCLYAQGGNYATPQTASADTIQIAGRLADGGVCTLELHSGLKQPHPFFEAEVVGTGGWLNASYEDNAASSSKNVGGGDLGPLPKADPGANEMDHFIDCILKGEAPRCGLAEMEYTAACVAAVQKSMVTGQAETVEEG